ncbi:MAG: dockerin type I domain-containing protein [Gammaproteobacteria bacterium]
MKTLKQLGACALLIATVMHGSAIADTMSSANYSIKWQVNDGGGNTATSASYILQDSIGQPSPVGFSDSANYSLNAGFFAIPDSDADAVRDFMDNCTFDPNPGQLDSNGDGYGNRCDPDLDNSGSVNFADYAALTSAFLSSPGSANWNPDADLTGDGSVNFADIALFQFFFLGAPGPSGLAP